HRPCPKSSLLPSTTLFRSYESTGDRLQVAMDAFVLSGALKLYRSEHGVPDAHFRHHTMLVHQSVRQDDHADLALRINTMWHQARSEEHTSELQSREKLVCR